MNRFITRFLWDEGLSYRVLPVPTNTQKVGRWKVTSFNKRWMFCNTWHETIIAVNYCSSVLFPYRNWNVWNLKLRNQLLLSWPIDFPYHVHKSPPLILIFSQMNPVYTLKLYLRSILLPFSNLYLVLPSASFFQDLYRRFLCMPLLSHVCYMRYPFHSSRSDHPENIW